MLDVNTPTYVSRSFLVYLAGPIKGCTYEGCTAWRDYVRSKMPAAIQTMSPMRAKEYLAKWTSMPSHIEEEHPMSTQRGLTVRDRQDCLRSDAVIFNLLDSSRISIGTMIEIGWVDAMRIPIILVMDKNNIHDHPMLRECASYIVDNLDTAIDITINLLLPEIGHTGDPRHKEAFA